ncbi:MAG TPA: DUF1579 family protein [Terracidiphilus sp.]|nr:DUF1579 family protein [Terracidiphilus sp.]
MKSCILLLEMLACTLAFCQQPASNQADGLSKLAWMQGDWAGHQAFNTNGGPAMVGDATDRIEVGIAGKYLCEMLSTTLPGRKPTDTRHFISYDPKTNLYSAWWFNDTSIRPMELSGELTGNKLVLTSNPAAPGPLLRATYENPPDGTLTFLLEMKTGESWSKLFLTTYAKK